MAVGDAHVFPGFLTPVLTLTQLFFPKPTTTFLTCFSTGERQQYAGKKVRLNRGSNSQPPDHESDTLTTEPPWLGMDDSHCDRIHSSLSAVSIVSALVVWESSQWLERILCGVPVKRTQEKHGYLHWPPRYN